MLDIIKEALKEAHNPTESTLDYIDVIAILNKYLGGQNQNQYRNLSEILAKLKEIVDIEDEAILLKVLTEITNSYAIIKK